MIWCGIFIGILLGSSLAVLFMWQLIKRVEKENYIDDFERMGENEII